MGLNGFYSLASHQPFLTDLCVSIKATYGDRLSDVLILLPTRRGARAVTEAFSDRLGLSALVLPQIRAIGDLEEGEPPYALDHLSLDLNTAISPLRRRFELAKLIMEHYPKGYQDRPGFLGALRLAESLGGFFDSLALEEIDARDTLNALIYDEKNEAHRVASWAHHWQNATQFLHIATTHWPKRLGELGLLDPKVRQVLLIRKLNEQWRAHPPSHPIILAGSTGSAPAMADLMKTVADLTQGAVVLPGLDLSLADEAWEKITPSHPQYTLKALLSRHGLRRSDVTPWPTGARAPASLQSRTRLINEALRPAEATEDWRAQIEVIKQASPLGDPLAEGLEGLYYSEVEDDEEAAEAIALLLREGLEHTRGLCVLITPDQALSRRVNAHLGRFGIKADNSAGEALPSTALGLYLLDALSVWRDPFDVFALTSLIKNALCRLSTHELSNRFITKILSGARPNHFSDYIDRLAKNEVGLSDIYEALGLEAIMAYQEKSTLSLKLEAFIGWVEGLSQEGALGLWRGAQGQAAALHLSEWLDQAGDQAVEDVAQFVDLISEGLIGVSFRTGGNTHPRLRILGAIEARLIEAERVILAGLEETVWPPAAQIDPFLSRPLRARLGLPSGERRLGLSAHDFVQAASAKHVHLIVRKRKETAPMVASRYIWRLKTLCAADDKHLPARPELIGWIHHNRLLKTHNGALLPAKPPEPRPPVDVRPMKLSVTQVETFYRDPYATYARHILGLKKSDRLAEPFAAMLRGSLLHKAVELWCTEGAPLGSYGVEQMARHLTHALKDGGLNPSEAGIDRPLLNDMAAHFIAWEEGRAHGLKARFAEIEGSLSLNVPRGAFILTAKADRIDLYDDEAVVLDFKTGSFPSQKFITTGFSPQLTLTGAIIKAGGFGVIGARPIKDLAYVKLTAKEVSSKSAVAKGLTAQGLSDAALDQLKDMLLRYENQDQPYRSWVTRSKHAHKSDYDHLARRFEWTVTSIDSEGGEEE